MITHTVTGDVVCIYDDGVEVGRIIVTPGDPNLMRYIDAAPLRTRSDVVKELAKVSERDDKA